MVTAFNDYCIKRPLYIIIIALKIYAKIRYPCNKNKKIQSEKFYENDLETIKYLKYYIVFSN